MNGYHPTGPNTSKGLVPPNYDSIAQKIELKKWKKMAIFLADYMSKLEIMKKSVPENENDINSPSRIAVATMEEILEWAERKVSENEH